MDELWELQAMVDSLKVASLSTAPMSSVSTTADRPKPASGEDPVVLLRGRSQQCNYSVSLSTSIHGENLQLVNQVMLTSYLGKAFKGLSKAKLKLSGEESDLASNHGVLATSARDSSSFSSDEKLLSDISSQRCCFVKSTKSCRTDKRPTLKPCKLTSYSGVADVHKFHKFLQELHFYVTGYRLSPCWYAGTLSHFLKSKAYKFYSMMVFKNTSEWDLETFFKSLFNFCFPTNFCVKACELLQACVQGCKMVQEFICELKDLFMMVGVVSNEEKVVKL
jgi:hypothetical protein